ncbi:MULTISPECIES: PRD domain-containing protein [unclassified Halanaerobium]|uniref:PRD domain-containing protein n=1 Tax=unclassified Halanaerobium TaxID=2641197 RepID=UPI000DF1BE63|nr:MULTISPECIES: PRD domain-containing protein [unclassified Halanaerobium]RCW49256.1 BglG family transcriptional antiterminator [Halanaerobium sp. MA284_MarDTE_T2]RCW83995.1 BglG family transcriptional antiterminator [Halanaerobium sp. DL-01]
MAAKYSFRIEKIYNNNVILAINSEDNREVVVVGKGIGFNTKVGSNVEIPAREIEKYFLAYKSGDREKYHQLINQLDDSVIGVSEEIIDLAVDKFGSLNPHIHIALTDHIGFSVERIANNMEVANPFIEEIKALYTEEYQVAEEGKKIIESKLNVKIPESEIGFIAMHIHAARLNKDVSKTVKQTSLIKELVECVKAELKIDFSKEDLSYMRLINHLRFSLQRLENKKTIKNPLIDKIKEEFVQSFQLALNLSEIIEKRTGKSLPIDEVGYLALHLQRLQVGK